MDFEPVKEIQHLFCFLGEYSDLLILAVDLDVSDVSYEAVVALYSGKHIFRRYPWQ
jgi:hypothetical protein